MSDSTMPMTLQMLTPAQPVGTAFAYRKGRQNYPATVVGFHVEHDTDTGRTTVAYRVAYEFAGQAMAATVPISIVDRAVLEATR